MKKLIFVLAATMLPMPSVAQMGGGGMMMGSGAPAASGPGADQFIMSKSEERAWAACQAMPADDMAKDKKCDRLKRKTERIAAHQQ